jgi:UPF0042 nucleotide-binding protein
MERDLTSLQTTRLVLVTGPSGAGRSTAIASLEDLGFEAIDNLPLRLLPRLLEGEASTDKPMALGLDTRNRDFSVAALLETIEQIAALQGETPSVLYLDASADVLVRRFSETRRRHPLVPNGSPAAGVALELDMLAPIRARADLLVDTSELTIHDLRREISKWFADPGAGELAISVLSFSYKRGLPRGVDYVFDCRFLSNPHWVDTLRGKTGLEADVCAHVKADPRYTPFLDQVTGLLLPLIPAFRDEGKSHLAVAFGCTGGQHRSVVLAEAVAARLAEAGLRVSIEHRELAGRSGVAAREGRVS